MKVAVAGGTGVVGRLTTEALAGHGADGVVLARSKGIDLVTGDGLAGALAGVGAVIDVTNVASSRASVVSEFFETTSRNLMRAAEQAGVRHIVALSIIGVDRVRFGYYQGKLHQEEVLRSSPVPVSILRAAQFHEFPGQYMAGSSGPFVVVPRWRVQPIAAREVAAALARLAVGAPPALPEGALPEGALPEGALPEGALSELAGPREENMADLIRRVIRARGSRRRVIEVPIPTSAGKALATGGNLPGADAALGSQTFAEWLRSPDRPRSGAGSDG
jgi:uncharacterized protein YbjT (DUF2867 family)